MTNANTTIIVITVFSFPITSTNKHFYMFFFILSRLQVKRKHPAMAGCLRLSGISREMLL